MVDSAPSPAALPRVDSGCEVAGADVLQGVDIGVVVVNVDGTVCYRNTAAHRWLNGGVDIESLFKRVEVLGVFDGWRSMVSRVVKSGESAHLKCATTETETGTVKLFSIRCHRWRKEAVPDRRGVMILIEEIGASAVVDETQEITRRLASLGKLASRVAHELNNPLDGILRYVNLALRIVGDEPQPKLKSYLAESRTGLMRMVQIISDLLEYSRATGGEFEEVEVNQLIEEAIRASAAAAETNQVMVAADFQTTTMPTVRGSRLYQVCCNLIRNAIDAMPDGGRLTITSGIVDDQVVIRVADTGTGLPEPAEKVFVPFFTTKPPGKGTGLGLAICKDFIEDMHGTITAQNGENGGAVLTVRIPVASCPGPGPIMQTARSRGRRLKDERK